MIDSMREFCDIKEIWILHTIRWRGRERSFYWVENTKSWRYKVDLIDKGEERGERL